MVIHFELPWNPSRLEQRAGRVDRLGQTRRVHELALVAAHTAERLVVAPLVTRLAATATKRGRMLDALTESRVAEAVMQNMEPARVIVELRAATPAFAVPPPEDLASHAVREAARLEHQRRLVARSSLAPEAEAGQRAVAAVLRRRTRVPPGLYLVFALTLTGADGSPLHAEARLVRGEPRQDFSGVLSTLAQSHEAILRSLVRQLADDPRDAVARLESLRRERQQHREKAIADVFAPGQPSAARLLVQAGLFDRRSLRAAAAQAASASAHREEMNERAVGLGDSSPVESRARLIALLLVPDRR